MDTLSGTFPHIKKIVVLGNLNTKPRIWGVLGVGDDGERLVEVWAQSILGRNLKYNGIVK